MNHGYNHPWEGVYEDMPEAAHAPAVAPRAPSVTVKDANQLFDQIMRARQMPNPVEMKRSAKPTAPVATASVTPAAGSAPRDFLAEAEAELAHLDEYLGIEALPRFRRDAWESYLGWYMLALLGSVPFVFNWLVQGRGFWWGLANAAILEVFLLMAVGFVWAGVCAEYGPRVGRNMTTLLTALLSVGAYAVMFDTVYGAPEAQALAPSVTAPPQEAPKALVAVVRAEQAAQANPALERAVPQTPSAVEPQAAVAWKPLKVVATTRKRPTRVGPAPSKKVPAQHDGVWGAMARRAALAAKEDRDVEAARLRRWQDGLPPELTHDEHERLWGKR